MPSVIKDRINSDFITCNGENRLSISCWINSLRSCSARRVSTNQFEPSRRRRSLSVINLVPRALFPGFGGGVGKGPAPPPKLLQSRGKAPWRRGCRVVALPPREYAPESEDEHDMKNYADLGDCYPSQLLRDVHNSSYHTKAEFSNCFFTIIIYKQDVSLKRPLYY